MPFTVDGLYLMNFTVIGVEEIASVREVVRHQEAALEHLGPLHRTHSPAMLENISWRVNSVAHLECNSAKSHWKLTGRVPLPLIVWNSLVIDAD